VGRVTANPSRLKAQGLAVDAPGALAVFESTYDSESESDCGPRFQRLHVAQPDGRLPPSLGNRVSGFSRNASGVKAASEAPADSELTVGPTLCPGHWQLLRPHVVFEYTL
jgi:hypothetical protein